MQGIKLSPTQRAILEYLAAGHAPFLAYYVGDIGTEGRGAGFYWRQFDRKIPKPKLLGSSVNGLIKRGLLQYDGYGDYVITRKGRAALGGGT